MEPVTRIAKYEVGRKLGQGGFGEIYVARDTELDREIAIKVLRDEHTRRPPLVQRFLQEARAAARINHPGIVTVFECGQTDAGIVFIAMELLAGETLATRIKREYLTLPAAIAVTRQLASALAAAHAAGIIHRDLKPQNVFLVPDPAAVAGLRVKILDFGIAKLTDALASNVQTHSMEMMGTPLYMSPEQCKSSATVDARSDIYALGCILFELLSGRTPFEGESGELIAKHQLVPPPQLHELVTGVPAPIEQLVAAMLAKAPGDRPTMAAIIEALDASPTADALVRTAPPPSDVGFAPTLASGGTLTDANARRIAAATVPLKPTTPASTPAAIAIATETPRPRRRLRGWAALIVPACVVFAVIGVIAATHHENRTTPRHDDNPPITEPQPPIVPAPTTPEPPGPTRLELPGPTPPTPPTPPTQPKRGGDDDDDDSPLSMIPKHIPGLGACAKYMNASIAAASRGDQAAAEKAGKALAACETGDLATAVPAAKCAQLVGVAAKAEAKGEHAAAVSAMALAHGCKLDAHAVATAVTAACSIGDAGEAKWWWPHLSADDQAKLRPVCDDHDVDVE